MKNSICVTVASILLVATVPVAARTVQGDRYLAEGRADNAVPPIQDDLQVLLRLAVGAGSRAGEALILPHPDGPARAAGMRGQRPPGLFETAESILPVSVRVLRGDDDPVGAGRQLIEVGGRAVVRRQDIDLRRKKVVGAPRHQDAPRAVRTLD